MVQHHPQTREEVQAAVEQRHLVGGPVEPGLHARVAHGGQHREHRQRLGFGTGLALQPVEPDALDPGIDPALEGGQRVGVLEVVHGDACELARILGQYLRQEAVVLRQGAEDGPVHPAASIASKRRGAVSERSGGAMMSNTARG